MACEMKSMVTCDRCKNRREEGQEYYSSSVVLNVGPDKIATLEDLCKPCILDIKQAMEMPAMEDKT